jgi:hypothetical protein
VVLRTILFYKLGPSSFNTKGIDHGSSLRINYGMVTTEALGNYMRSSHQRKSRQLL